MPTLKNLRHERFAQFVALGTMSRADAFRQAGFKAKRADQGAYELVRRPEIASRIAALQAEATLPSSQRSLQVITRQELAELLAKVIKAGFGNPEKARVCDALKASELLTKLCGWNEPERALHQHQHIHVDASLIEQLRAGYSALAARSKPG
jgi:phage terminase small subunit